MVRFYVQGGPSWWRFQLVSLANERLPPARLGFYHILVDNGMYGFYKRGVRPDPDTWCARLAHFLSSVERLRRPIELAIILPDWLDDPDYTVRAASTQCARRLCRDYTCYAVAHAKPGVLAGHESSAEKLASMEHVHGLAAPLKINCSRVSRPSGKRIVSMECQRNVVAQIAAAARKHGVRLIHGLGVVLKPQHVATLVRLGLTSFDSAAWTRPNPSVLGVVDWHNCMNEKDAFLAVMVARLSQAGIPVEGADEALSRLNACRNKYLYSRGGRHGSGETLVTPT